AALGAHQLGGRGDETSPMRGKDGLPGGAVALEEGRVGTFPYQSGIGVYRHPCRRSARNLAPYPEWPAQLKELLSMTTPNRLHAPHLLVVVAAGILAFAACGSPGPDSPPPRGPPRR